MENEVQELYIQLGKTEYELIIIKNKLQELVEYKNLILEKIYTKVQNDGEIPPTNILDELKTFVTENK